MIYLEAYIAFKRTAIKDTFTKENYKKAKKEFIKYYVKNGGK